MPTGSGKTWLAKKAIRRTVQSGLRALYLTPLRALAEELASNWVSEFAGVKVGIFTGDYGRGGQAFPTPYRDARVLIMTPERLDVCTRTWRSHWNWIPKVDLVVVDEVHLLGDRGRGARLEGALSRFRRLNPFCRVLALSATLGNRSELAEWLGGVEFGSEWRAVPLEWRISRYRKADQKPEVLLSEARSVVEAGGQSLVFVQSRRRAEALARFLTERGLRADYHHAGLGRTERLKAEDAFRGRQTQVLVATGTLEMGLNLPARQVILYDLQTFNGSGFAPLSVNTVWQRAGRAGRPGLDQSGQVLLMAPSWDRDAHRYSGGRFERIESGMTDSAALAEQILVEVQSGLARSPVQLERVFDSSLATLQGRRPLLHNAINDMLSARMLFQAEPEKEEEPGEKRLKATPLGRVAIRHLLRPATILTLQRFLSQEPKFTHFDLLVAAACTDDCEPVLTVNFEELESLADRLVRCRSQMFQGSQGDWSRLISKRGKRLLVALKTAAALLSWSESGDIEKIGEQYDSYAFDLSRLLESMDRLLLAAGAIEDLQEPAGEDGLSESGEKEKPSRIHLLRQMLLNGVDEQAAALTLIPGVGAKWVRKLMRAGIANLPDLAVCPLSRLEELGGLSRKRALKWLALAPELLEAQPGRTDSVLAPFFRAKPQGLDLKVDPYRLRRALELSVESRGAVSWTVEGGLEPHTVQGASPVRLRCDCPDHAKGQVCKHILAVRLHGRDPELRTAAERMTHSNQEYFDLFTLWFDRSFEQ
jgi:helicase